MSQSGRFITGGGGSAITFIDWTPWTPTVVGANTAGTTTYSGQNGYYTRIGNLVSVTFTVGYTAATGIGNLTIGGLPFLINSSPGMQAIGTALISSVGTAWPAGVTTFVVNGLAGQPFMNLFGSGSLSAGGFIQLANVPAVINGSLTYRV